MLRKPNECQFCPLEEQGKGFSFPEGSGVNKIMLCGEALGFHEANDGLPFRPYADGGKVLENAFERLGVTRDEFVLWNTIACRPPSNELRGTPYELQAIDHCKTHFRRVVAKHDPQVIVALGAIPTRTLTGLSGGKKTSQNLLRGFPIPALDYNAWVIPTYHPAFIVRGAWELFVCLLHDLRKALHVAKHGHVIPQQHYITQATQQDLRNFFSQLKKGSSDQVLSVDFETTGKMAKRTKAVDSLDDSFGDEGEDLELDTNQAIIQVNLSLGRNTGLAVDFTPQTQGIIQDILSYEHCYKTGHNLYHFDMPVALHNNLEITGFFENKVFDTMWAFHHLFPDLPARPGGKGKKSSSDRDSDGAFAPLQFCASFAGYPYPWKHLMSDDMGKYGCCDVDATLYVLDWVLNQHEHYGTIESYWQYVQEFYPILAGMSQRGMPLNRSKLKALAAELDEKEKELDLEIQKAIPTSFRPKKLVKQVPKVLKPGETVARAKVTVKEGDVIACPCVKRRKDKLSGKFVKYALPSCAICHGTGTRPVGSVYDSVVVVKPFLHTSWQQKKKYAALRGHTVPLNARKKLAMDRETLEKLSKQTKDPVYELMLEAGKFRKIKGTYAQGFLDRLYSDDRVRTTFLTKPATGQLSSVNPNIQITPNETKYGELATKFRQCVEAPPGFYIVEADYKSFHAQTLGQAAHDPSYIRLARIDIHSYLASWMLRLPGHEKLLELGDAELQDYLKFVKKNYAMVRDKQAKPGILGYGLGMTAGRLFRSNPLNFNSQAEAEKVFDALDNAFPAVKRYRDTIPLLAHKQSYLKSQYDCIRWFGCVMRWDVKRRGWVPGDDWQKAIAFFVQNHAHCHFKDVIRQMYFDRFDERFGLFNQVHDAVVGLVRQDEFEEIASELRKYMLLPATKLKFPYTEDPMVFDVEIKYDETWSGMKEYKTL